MEMIYRSDVNRQNGVSGNHGFDAAIPISYFMDYEFAEGKTAHTFYARIYVVDTSNEEFEIQGSPFAVTVR